MTEFQTGIRIEKVPPPGIIPLPDPLVDLATGGLTLERDLFFSGHTATLTLCALAVPNRAVRRLFWAAAVLAALGLLAQHVHYTVDVLAAPFFAYGAWRLARRAGRRRLGRTSRAWRGIL